MTARAAVSVALQGFGVLLGIVAQVLIARLCGIDEYGAFAFALASLNAAAIPARLGFDSVLLRVVGVHSSSGNWPAIANALRVAGRSVLVASLVLAVIMAVWACLDSARSGSMMGAVIIASLTLPFTALVGLRQSALIALGRPVRGLLPDCMVRPLLLVAVAGGLLLAQAKVTAPGAMIVVFVAALFAFGVGTWWLRDAMPPVAGANVGESRDALVRMAVSLLMFNGAYAVLSQSDVIVVGLVLDQASVATYSVVKQVTASVMFGLTSMQLAVAPSLAALHAEGRHDELQAAGRVVAAAGMLFAALLSGVLLVLGRPLLGLYGEEFQAGFPILTLLLIANVINAAAGPIGVLVAMTGAQAQAAWVYLAAGAANIVLVAAGARYFGLQGAAVAAIVTTIFWTRGLARVVRRQGGVRVGVGLQGFTLLLRRISAVRKGHAA